MTTREKIELAGRSNPIVRAHLETHRYGVDWIDMLEALVLSLAFANDELMRRAIEREELRVPPPVLFTKQS